MSGSEGPPPVDLDHEKETLLSPAPVSSNRLVLVLIVAVVVTAITSAIWAGVMFAPSKSSSEFPISTIIISIDGFRYDYQSREPTPNLDSIVARGFRVGRLEPIFPSLTFPNHYTLVTGLFCETHGIVANNMYDPTTNLTFTLTNGQTANGYWFLGEPIWVTAQKWGMKTGVMFWPGSEAEIDGMRPTYWYPYNSSISNDYRMNQLLTWLDLPAADRPQFMASYISDVDTNGHNYGPNSAQVNQSIMAIDTTLSILLNGIKSRGLENRVNVLVVSDHGMTDVNKLIYLDDIIDLSLVTVVNWLQSC